MDKTIKELAEQYGMSKQAISYHIKKLPKEYKNFDTKNGVKILMVSPKGQEILEEMLSNKVAKEVENFGGKDFDSIKHQLELAELEIKHLQEQIKDKSEQINSLHQRLEESHKLLDQQQQLCAMNQKKIEELEDKKEEPVEPQQKKSWWKFWI